ncbi:helix-turn-helix transcriptional regulator [Sphaerisporangium rubeum]|uniref:Transcriptional regulator with XRE-family HTH domain n=1 Tax=Sphaerisporangium rubeum TaxID=321317 RepID=A0A7X0IK87_9ACTN|nr:helix-turn-helix transcriptional regulator [Sphaerisporangium rubeum]MBB6475528.1 transcriptional regulator with XRE-family HTH domain [Sphaerisporangium rubeum]
MTDKHEHNPETSPVHRFGYELRRRRLSAHLTQEGLAEKIGYSGGLVSMVETGRRMPKADFAQRVDDQLQLNGVLLRMWDECRADGVQLWFIPWLEAELKATTLHSWQHSLVPGLLQTPDYARTLFQGEPQFQRSKLDQAVTARLDRQTIFEREDPPMMWAVLDEVVLQRPIGGASVMRKQLEHLVTMSDHPCIAIQIVPFEAACTPGLLGAFILANVQGQDVAYLESANEGKVIASPEDVRNLRTRYDAIRIHALPQAGSKQLIKEWAQKWMS